MDLSKSKQSKNFEDKTGARIYNDLGKFLSTLSLTLGIEERMPTYAERRAEEEQFNREQEEYIKRWERSMRELESRGK